MYMKKEKKDEGNRVSCMYMCVYMEHIHTLI